MTAALLLHESGHIAAMLLCGMRECSVELTPFGGMADVPHFDMYSPIQKAAASAAGVVVSAVAAVVMHRSDAAGLFALSFFQSNMSLAMLNMLPAWPLDGARVIAAAAGVAGWENQARKLLAFLGRALGVLLTALGLYGIWMEYVNLSLLLIGPYLYYAAGAEQAQEKVKRLNALSSKLRCRESLPVEIHATALQGKEQLQKLLLKKLQYGHYLVLLQLDPSGETVQKYWTENELFGALLNDGTNCRRAGVDKTGGL